jgi:D-tyrosyl-tRNA(Tyr) deacylase
MIALIQRVNWARVKIDGQLYSEIGPGLLAFIGIETADNAGLTGKLVDKILAYRVFGDDEGRMNLDLKAVGGELMLVSQFTLAASTDKGLRPSFTSAKPPAEAEKIYQRLVATAMARHEVVRDGKFATDMQITLENDGPVTFILQV